MTHNLVQILVAAVIIGDSVFLYLPYMLVLGGLAGLFTGICCHFCLATAKRVNKSKDANLGGGNGNDCDIIENAEDTSDGVSALTESEDKHSDDKRLDDNETNDKYR